MTVDKYLALDYGDSRIGVAIGDSQVKIAVPQEAIPVDGEEMRHILGLIKSDDVKKVVIGYPRNQSGQTTKQTTTIEAFASQLKKNFPEVVFQDESLTSVLAEERLKSYGRAYSRGDIDSMAAAIILEDYLEQL